jgi:hypothetical protein
VFPDTKYITFVEGNVSANATVSTHTALRLTVTSALNANLEVTGSITATSFIGNASTATSITGGAVGSLLYQSAAATTTTLPISTVAGRVLRTTSTLPAWSTPGGFAVSFAGDVSAIGNYYLAYNLPLALVSSATLVNTAANWQNIFVMPYSGILVAAAAYTTTATSSTTGTILVNGAPTATFAAGNFTATGSRTLTLSSTTTTATAGAYVEVRINVSTPAPGPTMIILYFA